MGKNQNIVMVGFTSSGKTKTGRLLAKHLSKKFFDLDDRVEMLFYKKNGKKLSCREIFIAKGEGIFRQFESQALEEISQKKEFVLSTGGGAILSAQNRTLIKKIGVIIYLKVEPHQLIERMQKKGLPAFLQNDPTVENLSKFVMEREPLYMEIADFVNDTSYLEITESIQKILDYFNVKKN